MLIATVTPTERTFRVHNVPGSMHNKPRSEIHKRGGRYYREDFYGSRCLGVKKILAADARSFLIAAESAGCVVERAEVLP